jgi:hypothetical protein
MPDWILRQVVLGQEILVTKVQIIWLQMAKSFFDTVTDHVSMSMESQIPQLPPFIKYNEFRHCIMKTEDSAVKFDSKHHMSHQMLSNRPTWCRSCDDAKKSVRSPLRLCSDIFRHLDEFVCNWASSVADPGSCHEGGGWMVEARTEGWSLSVFSSLQGASNSGCLTLRHEQHNTQQTTNIASNISKYEQKQRWWETQHYAKGKVVASPSPCIRHWASYKLMRDLTTGISLHDC